MSKVAPCINYNTGKEYSLADYRWGVSDPTIVSLEIITVIFDGLCCVILVYAILKDRPYRWVWSYIDLVRWSFNIIDILYK